MRTRKKGKDSEQFVACESAEVDQSPASVLIAVESLYGDGIQPFGRNLRNRLREQAAVRVASEAGLEADSVNPETMSLIDPKQLRAICENIPQLDVTSEFGSEFLVLFKDRASEFVDPLSRDDPYSEEMWADLVAFYEALSPPSLPGGRYACARFLVNCKLPSLQGLSLGEVCHVVQLSISPRRLLGHQTAQLVPFHLSDESVKDQCAALGQKTLSSSGAQRKTLPTATLSEAKHCLCELLRFESNSIVVSNVKRLFRSRFGLDLSETSLGHSRLSNLLQDPCFQDICILEVRDGQHMVKRIDCGHPMQQPPELLMQSDHSGGVCEEFAPAILDET